LLNDFANFVNDYKTKYEMFIFFIIRRFKTTIIVFKVIVSKSLVDIIVLVLLLKKRNQLFKTTKNALMPKKKDRLSKIKTITNSKKDNDVKTLS
jgi:hypothetical protein